MLDGQLSAADQAAFFEYVESHTLAEAQKWLHDDKLIELSQQAISAWAARKRKEAGELKFRQLLTEIKEDALRAEEFGQQIGTLQIAGITQANVAMLSQALFRAQRTKDRAAVKFFTNMMFLLLQAVSKQQSAAASVISAETARDRFQFDAAKRALQQAALLQRINEDGGHERDKVERAIETLFGHPSGQHLTSLTRAGGSEVRSQRVAGIPSNIGDVNMPSGKLTSENRKLTSGNPGEAEA